jgi:hypothetical protein
MLSFQSEPENKLFFLGALAGIARAGAGAARAGAARAGAVRPRVPVPRPHAPIKSLGGITISPSSQKSETTTNDNSTNSTVIYNK